MPHTVNSKKELEANRAAAQKIYDDVGDDPRWQSKDAGARAAVKEELEIEVETRKLREEETNLNKPAEELDPPAPGVPAGRWSAQRC